MRRGICKTAFLVLSGLSAGAHAQSQTPWDGAYLGVNIGAISGHTCSVWTSNGEPSEPQTGTTFASHNCSTAGNATGGLQLGDNFQYKRVVWGLGLDLDAAAAKTTTQVVKLAGEVPPPGTYVSSQRPSPGGFALVGPRLGYAGDTWLPYVRVGSIIADGSRDSVLGFTPAGTTKQTVSFVGARNFATIGWAAGAGAEIGLNGPWSITVDYLRINLGRGTDTAATCSGSAAACAAFAKIPFESMQSGFSAAIYRIGITYWFDYWGT